MKQIFELIKRNFRLYIRDKHAVFFSLLSMIIVIGLMIVFLGDMNVQNIVNLLEEMGVSDLEAAKNNAELYVLMWTIAGVISVNTVTVSISIIQTMVEDLTANKLQSFYTAPVSRVKIAFGYIGASWIGTVVMCIITFIIAEIFAVSNGVPMLSALSHLKVIAVIVVNAFVYSSIMYFVALFVKGSSAWSGLSTIIGTLVGFLGAIYLPMGALPEGVQNMLKCTPVLHSTSILRSIFTENITLETFKGIPDDIISEYKEVMGVTISLGDKILNPQVQVAIILLCGIIILALSAVVMKKKSISDR